MDHAPPEILDASASDPGACTPSGASVDLVGSVAGRPVQVVFSGGSKMGFPVVQPTWSVLRASSADQALLAWGEGDEHGGPQRNAGGLVVLADEAQAGSTFYCATQVEATLTPGDASSAVAIVLSGLSQLGRCPGTEVSGSVDVCIGSIMAEDGGVDRCASGFGVSGTIDGTEVKFMNLGGEILAGDTEAGIRIEVIGDARDAGAILFDSHPDGSANGWVRLPSGGSPNAGVVYCLEDGRALKVADHAYALTFGRIGRLGICPGTPIEGKLAFCW